MKSVPEAQKIVAAAVSVPTSEVVPLAELTGRVLAEPILAPFPRPRYTDSAMDGFAVRTADLARADKQNPIALRLVGVTPAGAREPGVVGPGECRQVMTGAAIPEGADAVVKVEDTSGFEKEPVQVYHAPQVGENMRKAGEEIPAGELLLTPGTRFGPGELGILAGCGLDTASVYLRPPVALITTGDELVRPGEPLSPGMIYNSNLPVLRTLAELAGATIISAETVPDDQQAQRDSVAQALEQAKLVVVSGGVSMGRFDHVREVLRSQGIRERFWRVAQKPGKPLYFGTGPDTLVFGLPGNPVSAFICFMEFIWPALERLQGLAPRPQLRGTLSAPYPRERKLWRFLLGEAWVQDGRLMVRPSGKRGSHMFTTTLKANCILSASPGEGPLEEGAEISVRLLPWTLLPGEA
ncbi:MAG: molybdopterin molybdotransferase MoeA [Candidatus Marinimicrobia bacterium]|nr:molybdopterin molybdotransferase MoeA [Candidatus Neomarinimicrobiota bacterium]